MPTINASYGPVIETKSQKESTIIITGELGGAHFERIQTNGWLSFLPGNVVGDDPRTRELLNL